jgi:Zn-dependent peptidase ImmA (M78 family)
MDNPIGGSSLILEKPASQREIHEIAQRLLRRTDSIGVLPTPVDRLIALERITDLSEDENFVFNLMRVTKEQGIFAVRSLFQKIQGVADRRRNVIYVDPSQSTCRQLFTRAHELGHLSLEWQRLPMHVDNQATLSPHVKAIFEREANYFASEVIFQGKNFLLRARDVKPSFDAVFQLADDHGASRHATAHQFIEAQDEAVALVTYWPTKQIDENGYVVLARPQIVGSSNFAAKYSAIVIPSQLGALHPWTAARQLGQVVSDQMTIPVDGNATSFEWHSWWNTYSLFVLIRRKPFFSSFGLKAA